VFNTKQKVIGMKADDVCIIDNNTKISDVVIIPSLIITGIIACIGFIL